MQKINELLKQTAEKLIALQGQGVWDKELLSHAPPVLWFGNSQSKKPKILTIGANPSRWEFLERKNINKADTKPQYLSKNRFCHLSETESYKDILLSEQLREKIISSYNNYFETNPYNWFGKNKNDSYNAEGLLRGMGASYFNNPKDFNSEYQACHIDIFPFATVSDFNSIQKITEQDILNNNWAKNIVDELITYFNPEKLLVFGAANFRYFSKYFGIDTQPCQKEPCTIWNKKYGKYHLIGISPNLGNPRGFNAKQLFELGQTLKKL